jgi:hypothetical protein
MIACGMEIWKEKREWDRYHKWHLYNRHWNQVDIGEASIAQLQRM